MNAITENILREAADAFAFDRTTGEISRYGEGHINDNLSFGQATNASATLCSASILTHLRTRKN